MLYYSDESDQDSDAKIVAGTQMTIVSREISLACREIGRENSNRATKGVLS